MFRTTKYVYHANTGFLLTSCIAVARLYVTANDGFLAKQ